MAEWHIRRNGKEEGPVDTQELKRLAASGELQPTDEIWREGMADWVPASKTKGLFTSIPEAESQSASTRPAVQPAATLRQVPASPKAKPWLLTKPGLLVGAGGLAVIVLAVVFTWLLASRRVGTVGGGTSSFMITVETGDIPLYGGYPKYSVDHELRINGRVVDKITNESGSATFTDVEVKAGDKISARSGWKNGYGAVTKVFEYTPVPIVADIAKTSYNVYLYQDDFSYKIWMRMQEEHKDILGFPTDGGHAEKVEQKPKEQNPPDDMGLSPQ